jgi:hypothetical protein
VEENANSEAAMAMAATAAMAVTAVMEDSLVDPEEAIEATAMDVYALAMAQAATRKVGRSSTRASHTVVDTNNRIGAATNHRVAVATVLVDAVVAMKAHVSLP